jgi:hypothetical protein
MVVPFARLGVGHDPRRFALFLFVVAGLWFTLTAVPLTFFLIRFIRYKRRHPWTPPSAANPVFGAVRRRPDRIPRALQI